MSCIGAGIKVSRGQSGRSVQHNEVTRPRLAFMVVAQPGIDPVGYVENLPFAVCLDRQPMHSHYSCTSSIDLCKTQIPPRVRSEAAHATPGLLVSRMGFSVAVVLF